MRRLLPIYFLALLFTSNSPAQWVIRNSGTPAELKDVVMLDSLTAIAVGNWGTLLKTTNAGLTWVPKPGGGFNWNAVAFANPFRGIVVGESHIAKTTTDGGETWSNFNAGGSGDMLAAAFMGDAGIFIGTATGQITYSTDQGLAWNIFPLDENPRSIHFTRTALVSYNGHVLTSRTIFKTVNSGETWTFQPLPIPNSGLALGAAKTLSGTSLIVGLDVTTDVHPIILRQALTDSGWLYMSFETSFPGVFPRDVAAAGPFTAYACGTNGLTLKTTDDGLSWNRIPTTTTRSLNAIHFYNERRGFAVGEMGMILFTANGGIATDVRPDLSFPQGISLSQNYPNPFNPATEIQFTISSSGKDKAGTNTTLKVFDLNGCEVASLVNERLASGTYRRIFNGEGLPTGVYFYTLESGGFRETRKLLLLK